jgi:hypothetical protein
LLLARLGLRVSQICRGNEKRSIWAEACALAARTCKSRGGVDPELLDCNQQAGDQRID